MGFACLDQTGLPTVIGWDWHQKHQRSILLRQVIEKRMEDVNTIYTSLDLGLVQHLLDYYDVQYICLGPLERMYYAGDGLAKFDLPNPLWTQIYESEQVWIFKVNGN